MFPCSCRLFALSGMVLFVAGWVVLAARGQGEDAQQLGSSDTLPKLYKAIQGDLRKLVRGDKDAPTGKKAEEVMDIAAQWFAYRPTWTASKEPKNAAAIVDEFYNDVLKEALQPFYQKTNKEFTSKFGVYAAKRFKELFDKKFSAFPIGQLNAAQMLPLLAQMKQEEVADLLVEISTNKKQHESVRLYALKGLREFFPLKEVSKVDIDADDKNKPALLLRKKRNDERVRALLDYIERTWPGDMEPDVVRFIRREAITSLAQAGLAYTYMEMQKGSKDKAQVIEGPVAYGLLRVLVRGKAGLDPEPSTQERIEAILGVCKIKAAEQPAFDAEQAVMLVGVGLHDVFKDYKNEYVKITSEKLIPKVYWRKSAERLKQGLQELAANTKGTSAHALATTLEKECKDFFPAINNKTYQNLERLDLFKELVDTWEKKLTGQVYKGYPKLNLKIDKAS